MITKKELILLCHGLQKEKKYKPFVKLLEELEDKFNKDPIEVLINSKLKECIDDKKLLGECVCKKKKLRFNYLAEYDNKEYTLGSNCFNSLGFFRILKEYLINEKNLSISEIDDLNKLNKIYEAFKQLHYIPCRNPRCNKKINITSEKIKDAEPIYKTYCKSCINSEGKVKCITCDNYKNFNDNKKCAVCRLKDKGLKKCLCISCNKLIDLKYKFCYTHKSMNILGKKQCENYSICQNWCKKQFNTCYSCNSST